MRLTFANNNDWIKNKILLVETISPIITIPDEIIQIYTKFSTDAYIPNIKYYIYQSGNFQYNLNLGYIKYSITSINIYLNQLGINTYMKNNIIYINKTSISLHLIKNRLIINAIYIDTYRFEEETKYIKDFEDIYNELWDNLKDFNIKYFSISLIHTYINNKLNSSLLCKLDLKDKSIIPSINGFRCTNKAIYKTDLRWKS